MSLSAAITVQKKATITTEEQNHLNHLFATAATAGDLMGMRDLLDKGALRGVQDYNKFLDICTTSEKDFHSPYGVIMSVFGLLEDYFMLNEDAVQTLAQGHDDVDRVNLKTSITRFRQFLKPYMLNQGLLRAVKDGNAHLVKELIKEGAFIDYYDHSWITSFEWAAIKGHTEIMNILLGALEDTIAREKAQDAPRMVDIRYQNLIEVQSDSAHIVPLFQRDVRSLEEQMKCVEKIDLYCKSSSLDEAKSCLRKIQELIKIHLSRDIIFTFFSSHNNSLHLSLKAIGAQQLAHGSHAIRFDAFSFLTGLYRWATTRVWTSYSKQEHLDRLLLFAAQMDDELVKALIDEGADVNTVAADIRMVYGMRRTPLHIAAYFQNIRAARILLRAGASIDAQDRNGTTPLYVNGSTIVPGVAKLLLEWGATLKDNYKATSDDTSFQAAVKTVLEAGVRRFMPTRTEAKIALQNIAFLIYILGIKLRLPPYVIPEIICFATTNPRAEIFISEWTQQLKRDLVVLYLYKCNGNKLFPLWAQTVRCFAKDPQELASLMSKVGSYLEPFLANDTKRFACLAIMNEVAKDNQILGNKTNNREILVDNRKLYFDHLDQYLQVSDFDEE